MSTKKSLLALLAAAMATMAFASPAMATDGVLRDVGNGQPIPENTVLHMVGWAKFETPNASFVCDATSRIEVTGKGGTTGNVTAFTIPDTSKCTGTGAYKGCILKTHEAKNLPWATTVTDNGMIDITGTIEIHDTFSGCLIKTTLLTLSEIKLTPLATGTRAITGGTGEAKLGVTAFLTQPIAGFEIDGFTASGQTHHESSLGTKFTETLTGVSGEFELTKEEGGVAQRCTYEITAS